MTTPSNPGVLLRAGGAEVTITPPLGTSLAGGFRDDRPARDVAADLHAHALVLEEVAAHTTVALVSCDLICVPGDVVRAARRRIAQRVGIPAQSVLVAATHTHSGPTATDLLGVPRNDAYAARLPAAIADAVELAARRRRPARIAVALGREEGVTFNRRFLMRDGTVVMNPGQGNPDIVRPVGPTDPDLAVLYVEGNDGAPVAAVVNFALHYVGTDDRLGISPDYFGHVGRLLRQVKGEQFVTVFFNGACGDVNQVDVGNADQQRGDRQARRVAEVVVGGALRLIGRANLVDRCHLTAATTPFRFPRKTITADDLELAAAILDGQGPVPVAGGSGPFSWVVGQPLPADRWAHYALECRRLAAMPEELETELQAVQVGDAVIVALPGEIFCELGLALKRQSPYQPTLIAELANDYIGYVCTQRAIAAEGGYETWAANSALPAAGAGEAMVDAAVALLERLHTGAAVA